MGNFPIYALFAFCLGTIPTAYWAGKLLKNIDIRTCGSGNVGATNAFRVLGKGPGIAVFILDLLKGALPVYLFTVYGTASEPVLPMVVGCAAVLGHVFTPFLGFKGGKGVATGAGVLLGAHPNLFLITLSAWILLFLATKIVSLSSLAAVSALLGAVFLQTTDSKTRIIFLLIMLFIYWTHRANIQRLLRGKEKRMVN